MPRLHSARKKNLIKPFIFHSTSLLTLKPSNKRKHLPAKIYLLKVNNEKTRKKL